MGEQKFAQMVLVTSPKMAATAIYGKTPLKIFSKTRRLMTLELGMYYVALGMWGLNATVYISTKCQADM